MWNFTTPGPHGIAVGDVVVPKPVTTGKLMKAPDAVICRDCWMARPSSPGIQRLAAALGLGDYLGIFLERQKLAKAIPESGVVIGDHELN